jgi:hypothetical protein
MFYDRIMGDESLAPFFADLDMDKQINKQIAFMTMAFGGRTDTADKISAPLTRGWSRGASTPSTSRRSPGTCTRHSRLLASPTSSSPR